MKELDRMIRRAGGVLLRIGRHRIYMLDGERITLHIGSKSHSAHITGVREKVRKILRRRSAADGAI